MKKVLIFAMIFWVATVPGLADKRVSGEIVCRVTDQNGTPVPGASIIMYDRVSVPRQGGVTDKDGIFSCFMRNLYPPIRGSVSKYGYYRTWGYFWRGKQGVLPDGKIEINLKKISDPVAMEGKRVSLWFIKPGQPLRETYTKFDYAVVRRDTSRPIGLDMEMGDWLPPDGEGKVADCWITGEQEVVYSNYYQASVKVVFSNELDGVQRFINNPSSNRLQRTFSSLPPPNVAPLDGYTNAIFMTQSCLPFGKRQTNPKEGRRYIFRVRTKTDEAGNIVSGNYGWITGCTMSEVEKDGPLSFRLSYYWNPDPTSRSLEPKAIADDE